MKKHRCIIVSNLGRTLKNPRRQGLLRPLPVSLPFLSSIYIYIRKERKKREDYSFAFRNRRIETWHYAHKQESYPSKLI